MLALYKLPLTCSPFIVHSPTESEEHSPKKTLNRHFDINMFNYQKSNSQVTSPRDLDYIKQLGISLNRIASWPLMTSKNKTYTFAVKQNIAFVSYMSVLLILQFFYIRNNIRTISFLQIGQTYVTFAMTIIAVQRLTMPWTAGYRQVVKKFLDKIHLFYQKDKSDYSMKVYSKVEKICIWFSAFVHIQLYGGILLFNVTPCYKNFKAGMYSSSKPANVTLETALYIPLPFDYLYNINGHIFISFVSLLAVCIGSSTFCFCHLLLSLIIFHIWGNLKILKHNLDNFPKPANCQLAGGRSSWYTEEESENVSTLIVGLVNQHRLIMDFMSETSNAYGFFLLLNFAFYQITGCIVLLECSKLDSEALAKYGPLTVILFQQLIQVSVIFELLGSQSETLIDSVYGLPWECMGLKNRKLVLFFLQNVQEPISLKACGMVLVGVQTMAAILKTCCSYFIMLRTVTAAEEMT